MTDKYWVGGSGNWDASSTANWSLTSGGAAGAAVPTSSDNVIFNSASNASAYTVTVTATANCADLTMSNPASGALTFTGSSALNCFGSFSAPTGSNWTYTGILTLKSTASGKIFTSHGISFLGAITFDGVGGVWTLQDTLATPSTVTVTLTNGTLDTNSQTLNIGLFASSNSNTRTLTLGSSAINLSGTGTIWEFSTLVAGFTLNQGTATITMNGAAANMRHGASSGVFANNKTLSNVSFTGSGIATFNLGSGGTVASLTRTGTATTTDQLLLVRSFTVTNAFTATGNTVTNRLMVMVTTLGTQTVVTAGSASITNVDFQDIGAAGASAPWSGTSIGNALGNSSITFDAPITKYWIGGTGNWNDPTHWSTSSGGSNNTVAPLPQDNVVLDALSGGGTVSPNITKICANLDMSAYTGTVSNTAFSMFIYGSISYGASQTLSGTNSIVPQGRGSHTITSNGKTTYPISLQAVGGTYTLADNLKISLGTSLILNNGTFDASSYDVTLNSISTGSVTTTRTLNMGSGTWTINGSGATTWTVPATTGLTFNPGTSTLIIASNTATSNRTFNGNGVTYGKVVFKIQGAANPFTIVGSNTFSLLMLDGSLSNASAINFTAGTTQTATAFDAFGISGQLLTLQSSSSGSPWSINHPGSVTANFVSVKDSTGIGGPFNASNSTNVSGNTNWIFNNVLMFRWS